MNNNIAIFHNALDTIGGGEMVALYLARELKADLYTTNIDKESIIKMGFEDVLNNIFSIGKIPRKAPFKQQMALYRFRKLNLKNKYQHYIIAGDWAMSAGVNNKPNLWYAHTPLNEIWSFKDFIKHNMLKRWQWFFYDIWCFLNQKLTKQYSKHIDIWISASDVSHDRIKKYYNQESKIIYPPIDTKKYKISEDCKKDDYWISVNRLAQNKRVEMQIEAFAGLENENLIIVYDYDNGSSELIKYKDNILNLAQKYKNIKLIQAPEKEDLINLYKKAKAFITTSTGESAGMTSLEAMSSGLPVIAPKDGGYRQTISDDVGILIEEMNNKNIIEAIKTISSNIKKDKNKYYNNCISKAASYDLSEFIRKIKKNML